jgi:hypothetical protein
MSGRAPDGNGWHRHRAELVGAPDRPQETLYPENKKRRGKCNKMQLQFYEF